MSTRGFQIAVGVLIVAVVLVVAIRAKGGGDGDRASVTAGEAKRALRELPYRYRFRQVAPPEGATSAIAGTAYGKHGAELQFGAAFGPAPQRVQVPGSRGAGALRLKEAVIITGGKGSGGVAKRRGNRVSDAAAQQGENGEMAARIQARLCREATGDPCPKGGGEGGPDDQAPGAGNRKPVFRTLDQGRLGK